MGNLLEKYYGFSDIDPAEARKSLKEEVDLMARAVVSDESGQEQPDIVKIITAAVGQTAVREITDAEYNSEIDHAKGLLDKQKFKEALDYLEDLEKRIFLKASPLVRFRILTNKAVANSGIGKEEDAGKLFVEAYQYNPDDEKALSNKAIGHLLLGQENEAKEFAEKVIEKNPTNARAYDILIRCTPDTTSIEDVITSIPVGLRENDMVAVAVSSVAKRRGDFKKAIEWLELAVKSVGQTPSPDLWAELASTILMSFTERHDVLNNIQIGLVDKEQIQRAIELLTKSIEAVSGSETINYRAGWWINRSSAYKLLGEIDKALADMKSALKISPADPSCLKQKAFLLYAKGDKEPAIAMLKELISNPAVPEVAVVLAEFLYDEKKLDDAADVLNESLAREIPSPLREEELRFLLQIAVDKKDLSKAREILVLLRKDDPANVLNIVEAAKIEKAAGNQVALNELLSEAVRCVLPSTSTRHIISLANVLYSTGRFVEAWPLYERITDTSGSSYLVDRLLYSYYKSGEVDKALKVCRDLKNEKNRFAIQVEFSILEDTEDLAGAVTVGEKYLSTHQDDVEFRARLASLLMRLDRFDDADKLLDADIDFSKTPLTHGFVLAGILAERGKAKKAIELAYELRRRFDNDGDAHLKYIGTFFHRDKELDPILHSETVQKDFVVHLKYSDGKDEWLVVEDRPDAIGSSNEIHLGSQQAKELLGKRVGDVIVHKASFSETSITIVEIKSKYVYALHKSMELIPQRFPTTAGFERFPVTTNGTREEIEKSFQPMIDALSSQKTHITQVEEFYYNSKITIGTFAQILNKNVIDIWAVLSTNKSGRKNCLGTPEEREAGVATCGKGKTVSMDVTALLTVFSANAVDIIEVSFEKIFVTQSTVDIISLAIAERKSWPKDGYTTVHEEAGKLSHGEVAGSQISKEIDELERIKKWIKDRCTVPQIKSILKLGEEKREKLIQILGNSFLDTMLVAQENSCPIFSDDYGTRAYALNEFKIAGIWTQTVVIAALNKEIITQEKADKVTVDLALMNYKYTSINGSSLLEAAKQAAWQNTKPYSNLIDALGDPNMEIRSALSVVTEFAALLWNQPILDSQRELLFMAILDAVSRYKKIDDMLRILKILVQRRLILNPIACKRILEIIVAWGALNMRKA